MRERLEEHRKNPACATCHAQMDPLGFALENFDAIGKWRTTSEGGAPIDASAVLSDRCSVQGPGGIARGPARPSRAVCRHGDRKAPVVRARPRRRILRSAGRPQDRAQFDAKRLPLVVDHRGNRSERAVSDEDIARGSSNWRSHDNGHCEL